MREVFKETFSQLHTAHCMKQYSWGLQEYFTWSKQSIVHTFR